MDKFLASVDSELWALLSAREQQAASLHVGIIDGGPPRWLSKCGYVRAIFQPLPTIASTSPLLLAPLPSGMGGFVYVSTRHVYEQRTRVFSLSSFLSFSFFFIFFFVPIQEHRAKGTSLRRSLFLSRSASFPRRIL